MRQSFRRVNALHESDVPLSSILTFNDFVEDTVFFVVVFLHHYMGSVCVINISKAVENQVPGVFSKMWLN